MIAMANVLEFSGVERGYTKGSLVLKGVSFAMQREEVVALVGRNGAGKTTLMHLAMGLLYPQAGRVQVLGRSPSEQAVEVKRRIGYVGAQSLMPPLFRVRDAIDFHRKLYPSWDVTFERELLERFGLTGALTRRLVGLSSGQKQQLSLLCAVCHRPELLLLDEPAAGLDPAARREFLETSIQLLNREGTAILFSSHHMGDIERLGGRLLLLRDGVIALDQSLDTLREQTCLAVVPRRLPDAAERLKAMPEVLHVRTVVDSWHAVMQGDALATEQRLRTVFASGEVQCAPMPLEELFIEMAGGAGGKERA